jgi:hypothetical protein
MVQSLRPIRFAAAIVAGLLLSGARNRAMAQSEPPHTATPASYERDTSAGAARSIHFSRRAPQIGDQLEQQVTFELQLHQIMRRGDKVVEQAELQTHCQQRRRVTTTEVTGGATTATLVRYPEATQHVLTAQDANELRKLTAPADPQPVQGKVYRCRRNGEKLEITDAEGNIPPLDEFKIVAQNMDSLGRPNPLADFLGGRTVRVGEKLSLPHEVAERFLGLGDDLGQVSRFELVLDDVKTVGGAQCGLFRASIDAASTNASQMRMQVDGSLVIQADTCRAIDANLLGPLGMSETRGSVNEKYQISGTGHISAKIATIYRDVAR